MRSGYFTFFFALIIILILSACPDINIKDDKHYNFKKGNGFFIVNEGIFQQANASVFYYDRERDSIYENIYETVNNEKIGDILQSMYVFDDNAYLVVNNSAWIDIAGVEDFEKKGEIRGFVSPRYFFPVNRDKAYVTDLYSGYVYVVDLNQNKVSKNIYTGKWTEEMAFLDKKLYVTCPWIYSKPASKKVLVIDTDTDEIIDSIVTGISPSGIGFDKNGFLWTLNNGNKINNLPGSLYKIDVSSNVAVDSFVFKNTLNIFNSSLRFNENRDSIFVLYNDVYKISVEGNIAPEKIISQNERNLYGMDLDNDKQQIFLTDVLNFVEKGKVYIYSKKGDLLKTLNTGFLPNAVVVY